MQLHSLRLLMSFRRLYLSKYALHRKLLSSVHTSRGSIFIDLSTSLSSKTQKFSIIYRCLFCQQSSKKGEIVRASFAPKVLEIVGQSRSGTNIVFEYKHILRFRKNGVCK